MHRSMAVFFWSNHHPCILTCPTCDLQGSRPLNWEWSSTTGKRWGSCIIINRLAPENHISPWTTTFHDPIWDFTFLTGASKFCVCRPCQKKHIGSQASRFDAGGQSAGQLEPWSFFRGGVHPFLNGSLRVSRNASLPRKWGWWWLVT